MFFSSYEYYRNNELQKTIKVCILSVVIENGSQRDCECSAVEKGSEILIASYRIGFLYQPMSLKDVTQEKSPFYSNQVRYWQIF